MRVIDGMHRVRAYEINGELSIRARLLEVSDESAFLRSVQENVSHGLPLSLGDRRVAATRLLGMLPHWSDRALGRASGLSGKTIAALRRRLGEDIPNQRTSQDGRIRSLDISGARQAVEDVIAQRPEASLREVARAAGVSPNMVRNVRLRMSNRAADPADAPPPAWPTEDDGVKAARTKAALMYLSRDPSLRYTESGRALLRLFHQQLAMPPEKHVVDKLPPHCLPWVAHLARAVAQQWASISDLAGRSEGRASDRHHW